MKGETNSGKSSFINLILGHDLLPVGCLPTTRTVCEIKGSRTNERIAIIHRKIVKNERRHAPEILDLSESVTFEKFQHLVTEIDTTTGESVYDKIEIFWPCQLKKVQILIYNQLFFFNLNFKDKKQTKHLIAIISNTLREKKNQNRM